MYQINRLSLFDSKDDKALVRDTFRPFFLENVSMSEHLAYATCSLFDTLTIHCVTFSATECHHLTEISSLICI